MSTTPIAPSSLCTLTSTTVRMKLGSCSVGEASSSWPVSESAMTALRLARRPNTAVAAGRPVAPGLAAENSSSVPVSLWSLALPSGSTTCPSTTIGLFQCPGMPASVAIGRGEPGR